MNANNRTLCIAAVALLLLAAGPAWSSGARLVGNLSGTVTASPIGNEITVNGVTYPVVPSPDADSQLLSLKPGDTVDLILNAPPKQKGSAVVFITVHPRQEN